MTVFAVPQSPT